MEISLVFLWTMFFIVSVAFSSNVEYDFLWKVYQIKFRKNYLSNETEIRRDVWERNAMKIASHNLEADMGLHSFRLGLNRFTDRTDAERVGYRKCFSSKNIIKDTFKLYRALPSLNDLPTSVDWRDKGLVTPVKDQGSCGSCWAFSATGSLEGQNKAKSGVLTSLSEQNLVDCSRKQGNEGCDGGWMEYAFQYIIDNNGIDKEDVYKYQGRDGRCRFRKGGIGANCTKFFRIKRGSETNLQTAVANIGPVSVAIDAEEDFMDYQSGIYHSRSCDTADLNHAVLVVGYGTENGKDYWIVKNSWGTEWGMDGYILMSRNAKNQCGIASHAVFPII